MKVLTSVLSLLVLTIGLQAERSRIVSLGGAITETLFALGAGERVIARDDTSLFPDAALELPSVGYVRTIGAEGILAMRPDLILASASAGPPEQVRILQNSGIAFQQFDELEAVPDVLRLVDSIGEAMHLETEARELAATLEERFAKSRNLAANLGKPPRVAVLMGGGNSYSAAYDGTAASALIDFAGGENVFSGLPGYKPTSVEEIVAANPDLIFITSRRPDRVGLPPVENLPPGSPLALTHAAKEGRIYWLDMGEYLLFGPHIAKAALEFTRLLAEQAPR